MQDQQQVNYNAKIVTRWNISIILGLSRTVIRVGRQLSKMIVILSIMAIKILTLIISVAWQSHADSKSIAALSNPNTKNKINFNTVVNFNSKIVRYFQGRSTYEN